MDCGLCSDFSESDMGVSTFFFSLYCSSVLAAQYIMESERGSFFSPHPLLLELFDLFCFAFISNSIGLLYAIHVFHIHIKETHNKNKNSNAKKYKNSL